MGPVGAGVTTHDHTFETTICQYIDDQTDEKYIGLAMHSFWGLIDASGVGGETNIGEPSREYQTDPYADSDPVPEPEQPTVVISVSHTAVAPRETVELDMTASTNWESYTWEMNGETIDWAATPEYTFSETGEYDISLTVTNEAGDTDTTTTTVTVEESDQTDPTAAFDVMPEMPTVGEEVTFDASASEAPDGTIVSYEWDYDLQPGLEDRGETFSHTYESAETYDIRLVVTDDNGNEGETVQTVSVESAGDGGDGDDGSDGGDDGGSGDAPQWDPMSLYQVGDRVTYDGSTWEAMLSSLNAEPGPDSAYWTAV